MITEIEMRYAKSENSDGGNPLSGLINFEPPNNIITIHDIDSQESVTMTPQQAQDLASRINKMLEIVGGTL